MKRLRLYPLIFSLLIVSVVQSGYAQSPYRFQHFNSNDGLASDFSWSFAQDSLGFIWVQFYGGLSRFDGHDFKVYKHDLADSTRANLDFMLGKVDRQTPSGQIWFSEHHRDPETPYYLLNYDFISDSFRKYNLGLKGIEVSRVLFDDKDPETIWLGTWRKGLIKYNKQSGIIRKFLQEHPDGKLMEACNTILGISDRDSWLLISTAQGLWKFEKSTNKFSRPLVNPKDSTLLYHTPIGKIIDWPNDNLNDVWLFLQNELIQVNDRLDVTKRFTFPVKAYFNSYDRDKAGVFWFSSQGDGLFRYDPRDNSFINIRSEPGDPNGLKSNFIMDVFVDRDQNVWVASGEGISQLRKSSLQFHNVDLSGLRLDASAVYHAKDGDYVWIGQKKPSLEFEIKAAKFHPDDPGSLKFNLITTFKKGVKVHDFWQGKHNFWVSIYGLGVVKYPINPVTGWVSTVALKELSHIPGNSNSIGSNRTQSVWEDNKENVWVAMSATGLNKIATQIPYGNDSSVVHYLHSDTSSNSLITNTVLQAIPHGQDSLWIITTAGVDLLVNEKDFIHVFKDLNDASEIRKMKDGTLYLATLRGLFEMKKSNNRYPLEKIEAFNDVETISLQEDRAGRLWVFTSKGLFCYDREKSIAVNFNEKDGFLHKREIQDWMANHQTSDGLIVMHDRDGLSIFDPNKFQVSHEPTFPVLSGLDINNKPVATTYSGLNEIDFTTSSDITMLKELVVDYLHNNFSLEFSAMEMTAPEKNLYRHKLEGYDKDWIETDHKNRTATYTNLPSGTYTFRVKASNHHGVWSDQERKLSVVILPAPWRTWWAYTGYGLLVAGLLVWARRNIVQRERLKSNLRLAKVEQEKEHFELEKAKEVDKVKSAFFANISHEFRTPLTLIKGPVGNLLEQFASNEKVKDQLKLVQRNADLLLKLINQLLDLAKLEAGSLKVEKSEGDLNSFISAVSSSFSSLARQKNISLTVDLPDTRYLALFDKDKLETILINLINNAIKFTPAEGKVHVRVSLEKSDHQENNNQLIITVSDTGIGIPADQQTRIFERFYQVSESHKEVGTGIGLALVKELTALLGGSISVKSEAGKGSEFKVVLPIEIIRVMVGELTAEVQQSEADPRQSRPAIDKQSDEAEANKPQVLVVEDNADLRGFIIDSLGREFHFLEAENGVQGFHIATSEVPDLVISDVMMPEMDGITMAGKIKNDIRSSHIPLILLTAKSTDESKLSGLSSGADDYLTKPFNRDELLLKVRNGIAIRIKMREKLRSEMMSVVPRVEVLSADEQFMVKVKEAILHRLSDEQLSVESLAEEIGLSRVQLYRKITALTGLSVNELIRKLRLQKASQLLGQNWGPVSQVAYEVGFSNLSYFSKVFKEEFGVLPSEYGIKI